MVRNSRACSRSPERMSAEPNWYEEPHAPLSRAVRTRSLASTERTPFHGSRAGALRHHTSNRARQDRRAPAWRSVGSFPASAKSMAEVEKVAGFGDSAPGLRDSAEQVQALSGAGCAGLRTPKGFSLKKSFRLLIIPHLVKSPTNDDGGSLCRICIPFGFGNSQAFSSAIPREPVFTTQLRPAPLPTIPLRGRAPASPTRKRSDARSSLVKPLSGSASNRSSAGRTSLGSARSMTAARISSAATAHPFGVARTHPLDANSGSNLPCPGNARSRLVAVNPRGKRLRSASTTRC